MGLAIAPLLPLDRLHLQEVQLDGRGAAEDAHHDLDLPALVVHLVHHSGKCTEGAIHHPHVVADPERHGRHRLALGGFHLPQNAPHLVFFEGDRALSRTNEARDTRHVLHEMTRLVVQLHLDHHVRRKRLALRDLALAVLHLGEILGCNEDLAEMILERGGMNRLLEVRLHLVLVTRVRMDHVPLLRRRAFHAHRNNRLTPALRTRSTSPMKAETIATVTITTIVESRSSVRVGQLTFADSTRTSLTKSRTRSVHAMCRCPLSVAGDLACAPTPTRPGVAGLEGFEPPTPGFGDRCSSRTELQACLTEFLCARCASGTPGRTSSSPSGPDEGACSSS